MDIRSNYNTNCLSYYSKLIKKIICFQFFVGKKFIGHSMFDNNYSKIRKNSKRQKEIINYEIVSLIH